MSGCHIVLPLDCSLWPCMLPGGHEGQHRYECAANQYDHGQGAPEPVRVDVVLTWSPCGEVRAR